MAGCAGRGTALDPADKALCPGIPGVEVIHLGMLPEYLFYQVIYICVADQLGKYHLLIGAIADEGQREAFLVGF